MPALANCQDTRGTVRMLFLHLRGGGKLPVYDRACWGHFLKKQGGGYCSHSPQPHQRKHQLKAFSWQGLLFGNSVSPPHRLVPVPSVREYLLSILGPRCSGPQGKLWLLSGQTPWTFRETRNQTGYAPGSWRGSLWVLWPRPGVPTLHEEDFTWLHLMCHLLFSPTAVPTCFQTLKDLRTHAVSPALTALPAAFLLLHSSSSFSAQDRYLHYFVLLFWSA